MRDFVDEVVDPDAQVCVHEFSALCQFHSCNLIRHVKRTGNDLVWRSSRRWRKFITIVCSVYVLTILEGLLIYTQCEWAQGNI